MKTWRLREGGPHFLHGPRARDETFELAVRHPFYLWEQRLADIDVAVELGVNGQLLLAEVGAPAVAEQRAGVPRDRPHNQSVA